MGLRRLQTVPPARVGLALLFALAAIGGCGDAPSPEPGDTIQAATADLEVVDLEKASAHLPRRSRIP